MSPGIRLGERQRFPSAIVLRTPPILRTCLCTTRECLHFPPPTLCGWNPTLRAQYDHSFRTSSLTDSRQLRQLLYTRWVCSIGLSGPGKRLTFHSRIWRCHPFSRERIGPWISKIQTFTEPPGTNTRCRGRSRRKVPFGGTTTFQLDYATSPFVASTATVLSLPQRNVSHPAVAAIQPRPPAPTVAHSPAMPAGRRELNLPNYPLSLLWALAQSRR
ncbi:hypothetical protein EDC04DRAFT_1166835 [Pisolithus marmoratus]|nr:hypothetical protein EDC04DRAFT_1166835 [Pisolithus marmoratus]